MDMVEYDIMVPAVKEAYPRLTVDKTDQNTFLERAPLMSIMEESDPVVNPTSGDTAVDWNSHRELALYCASSVT
jgi:hypothetical protein